MKIALIHNVHLPVAGYGGTERVLWWLAKGLSERGHTVTLVCQPGSQCPFAEIFPFSFDQPIESALKGIDLYHYFSPLHEIPETPYAVTLHGNGKEGETYLPNSIFVSQNHARRHGAEAFVHNGLDPEEYVFESNKSSSLVFLAKARWRVKNVDGAIRFAKAKGKRLDILGGSKWLLNGWGDIHWHGTVDGDVKNQFLSQASALLFPVIWFEPFGLAAIEALISGTPVIASHMGALPEIVTPETGRLCQTEEDFLEGIEDAPTKDAENCRARVLENFTYQKMAEKYETYYQRILDGETLNQGDLRASGPPEQTFPVGSFPS